MRGNRVRLQPWKYGYRPRRNFTHGEIVRDKFGIGPTPTTASDIPPVSVDINHGIRLVWYDPSTFVSWNEGAVHGRLLEWLRENVSEDYESEVESPGHRVDILREGRDLIEVKERITSATIKVAIGQALVYSDVFGAEPWIAGLLSPQCLRFAVAASKHVGVYGLISENREDEWRCVLTGFSRNGTTVTEGLWPDR